MKTKRNPRFPKTVKFNGNPVTDNYYAMVKEWMAGGDTLEEALELLLLFEVKEQWMKYNTDNGREYECEWDLDNQVTLTYFDK